LPKDILPEPVMTIAGAWQQREESVAWEDCRDRVSAAFIYVYPPGIPLAVPGERITEAIIKKIDEYRDSGLVVHGIGETVACVPREAESRQEE